MVALKPLNPMSLVSTVAMRWANGFFYSAGDCRPSGRVRVVRASAVALSDVYLIDILNVDNHWQQNPALMDEFHNVPIMDFSRVIASADLLGS